MYSPNNSKSREYANSHAKDKVDHFEKQLCITRSKIERLLLTIQIFQKQLRKHRQLVQNARREHIKSPKREQNRKRHVPPRTWQAQKGKNYLHTKILQTTDIHNSV
jgi:hypothetical protein